MIRAATQSNVLEVLREERDYQDQKWNEDTTASGGKHSPTEWLVYIEDYVREAKQFTSRNPNPAADMFVLNVMRKIGAMAVACQEQNGVYSRAREGPRPMGYSE